MDARVDKNVPVPSPRHTGITALLRTLAVGESVLIDTCNPSALAYRVFGKGNYRSHKERGGVRIWRIV